ncbi:MAG: CoB--CoM heterodisulfide reductase iron-sulfur subunit A family protein, partial [Deltaproteobacteria bacterium]|nr:CoB--CoM heterodisulfide reductase iron-sulfur subunit A family protein [Deltaproteobacteria bacterium]
MPEKKDDDIRIGVFVCHCGSNIAGYLDVEAVADFAETLPHVAFVQRNLYTCSEGGINEIKSAIKEQNLNRVVVASCTPRTHEPLFRSSCAEAGLNPYLFEMVNIRDQCSWVHMQEQEDGTIKAKDLVRMGIAKAALALANRGYEVVLAEKNDTLGGALNRLNKLGPTMTDAATLGQEKIDAVSDHPKITVFTRAKVTSVQGFIGKYQADIETDTGTKNIDLGVIVVATGARTLVPEGLYGYDGQRVITQEELEGRLKTGLDPTVKHVVMIQCVGSRNEERPYCSRICCQTAVKNAMLIREKNPESRVTILYRDMQMYGVENEEMFRDSKAKGVRYINYDPSRPPAVDGEKVDVYHALLGRDMNLPADLVVLSTPLVSNE